MEQVAHLSVTHRPDVDVDVVVITGELDARYVGDLRRLVGDRTKVARGQVILDLSQVTFVDASAVGAIASCKRVLADRSAGLSLVCPPGQAQRILRLVGFDRVLPIYPDLQNALTQVPARRHPVSPPGIERIDGHLDPSSALSGGWSSPTETLGDVPRTSRIEPPGGVVARLGAVALTLPEAYEEDAWTGVRWRIRTKTFAHVMVAQAGYESSFRDITGIPDPTTILTFHSSGDELLALTNAGAAVLQAAVVADDRRHGAATTTPTGTRSPSWSPSPTGSAHRRSWSGCSTNADPAGQSVLLGLLGGVADLEDLGGEAADGGRHVTHRRGDDRGHLADGAGRRLDGRLDGVLADLGVAESLRPGSRRLVRGSLMPPV